MTGDAIEVAEFAIGDTDICRVDIAVYLPSHFAMRDGDLAQFVGHKHQLGERSLFKAQDAFFDIQEFFL